MKCFQIQNFGRQLPDQFLLSRLNFINFFIKHKIITNTKKLLFIVHDFTHLTGGPLLPGNSWKNSSWNFILSMILSQFFPTFTSLDQIFLRLNKISNIRSLIFVCFILLEINGKKFLDYVKIRMATHNIKQPLPSTKQPLLQRYIFSRLLSFRLSLDS